MTIKNFIRDALYKPNDYIAYHVGRELMELHPEKTILEGRNWYFDLDAFTHAEKCSVTGQKSVFQQVRFEWEGAGRKLEERFQNAWLNVLWKGQLLDVVLLTYAEDRCRWRYHWIVAEDRKLAEEFFDAVCAWGYEVRGEILVFNEGYFQKDKQLFESIKNSTFDNLVLPATLKQQIENDFQQFLDSREVYDQYKIPRKRGAIFIGPPGNGKTHALKALINQLGTPCLYVRSFKSEGKTEQENIEEVFERARMTTPSIVVLEDLDSMIDNKNRSFFLNELDGFQSNTGVVVLATTNHPQKLDPSILDRPSRFDRKYYFQLPAEAERLAYVAKWNEELQPELRVSEAGAMRVVSETEGFSFAYMKELFIASMVQWMSSGGNGSMDDVIITQTELLRSQMKSKKKKKNQ